MLGRFVSVSPLVLAAVDGRLTATPRQSFIRRVDPAACKYCPFGRTSLTAEVTFIAGESMRERIIVSAIAVNLNTAVVCRSLLRSDLFPETSKHVVPECSYRCSTHSSRQARSELDRMETFADCDALGKLSTCLIYRSVLSAGNSLAANQGCLCTIVRSTSATQTSRHIVESALPLERSNRSDGWNRYRRRCRR